MCQTGITLLEISSANQQVQSTGSLQELRAIVGPSIKTVQQLGTSGSTLYLALNGGGNKYAFADAAAGCYQVHLRTDQVLITLVGEGLSANFEISDKIAAIAKRLDGLSFPSPSPEQPVRLVVSQSKFQECLTVLHALLFAEPDSQTFAKCAASPVDTSAHRPLSESRDRTSRLKRALALVGGKLMPESA